MTNLQKLAAETAQQFVKAYGRPPRWIVAALGRANVIGEHTDYNDGFVLPMAIERYAIMAADSSSSSSFSQLTPSLILFVSNMNLPTLYFWLSSAASTYFHPSTVPQIAQLTSLTVCWPVTRFLGTALFWYVLGRPEACMWVWLGWP